MRSCEGKEATFFLKIKEVRERILPELDDEFAKDCGDYETLLELRLSIRKQLEEREANRQQAAFRENLFRSSSRCKRGACAALTYRTRVLVLVL